MLLTTPRRGRSRASSRPARAVESRHRGRHRPLRRLLAAGLAVVALPLMSGCGSDSPEPRQIAEVVQPPNPLPRFLRGSVRYEADLRGYGPTLAQGYGLVVGLDGTGSNDTPTSVRVMLEREYGSMDEVTGVDTETFELDELLDSEDTAVVLVEASIPPGAPEGTSFDVRVSALDSTSTTSLAGGRLWSTYLRRGTTSPTSSIAEAVAAARGEIFTNPFLAVEDESRTGGVNRRVGRILDGGTTMEGMPLVLALRTPSFSRSRALTDAINTRFPLEPGQREPTARPVAERSDEQIRITVPPSWRDRTSEFVEILMHTPLDPRTAERRALALQRWLLENPIDARSIVWSWVAIGERSLPAVQELYDHAEQVPRLAALRAGAQLGDPLATPHLARLALDADSPFRVEAAELLGRMPRAALGTSTLHRLLDDEDRDVRIAAMESLRHHDDPVVRDFEMGRDASFALAAVPSRHPMVYMTQHEEPRVVVFGDRAEVARPLLVSAWNDRFIVTAERHDTPLRVRYVEPRTLDVHEIATDGELATFVRQLGRDEDYPSTEPGLGMSYDAVVGTLFAMHERASLGAPLVIERDRLAEAILAGSRTIEPEERPESATAGTGRIDDPVVAPAPAPAPAPDSDPEADSRPERDG